MVSLDQIQGSSIQTRKTMTLPKKPSNLIQLWKMHLSQCNWTHLDIKKEKLWVKLWLSKDQKIFKRQLKKQHPSLLTSLWKRLKNNSQQSLLINMEITSVRNYSSSYLMSTNRNYLVHYQRNAMTNQRCKRNKQQSSSRSLVIVEELMQFNASLNAWINLCSISCCQT